MSAERACRGCGCTDDDCSGCIARTGQPCFWVEPDLCSACVALIDQLKGATVVLDALKLLAAVGNVEFSFTKGDPTPWRCRIYGRDNEFGGCGLMPELAVHGACQEAAERIYAGTL